MSAPNRPSWNWWLAETPLELASQLIRWADRARADDLPRKWRMCEQLCLYSNQAFSDLNDTGSSGSQVNEGFERLSENHIENQIHTVHAECVQNRTRMTCVTSGGDYRMKRQAKDIEKFSEGQAYEDGQEKTGSTTKLHALIWGTGVEYVYVNPMTGRVDGESIISWELQSDKADARYGKPRTMGRTHVFDRDVLKACYPDKADEIETAPRGAVDDYPYVVDAQSNLIVVSEAWHLPSKAPDPKKKGDKGSGDGRHVICIPGVVLLDEPWTRATFPFVFLHWLEPISGMWGRGMVSQLLGQQMELNRTLRHIQLSMKRAGNLKVLIDTNSGVLKSHVNDRIGTILTYNGSGGGHKPEWLVHDVVSPQVIEHKRDLRQTMYSVEGVSQMASQGMLPQGMDKASGRAIRMADSISSKRRLPFLRDCETFDREVAELKIELAVETEEKTGEPYVVSYHGKKRIEPIRLKGTSLKRDGWWMRVYPTSALPSEPSARIATLDDWVNAGLISKADYKRLADFPDLEDASTLETAMYELCEEVVDNMLYDGTPYAPEPLQDKQLFARIALQMYTRAKLDGINDPKSAFPEEHMDMVRQFIVECLAPEPTAPTDMLASEGAPPTGEAPAPGASAGPVTSAPIPAPTGPPPGPAPPPNMPPPGGPPS